MHKDWTRIADDLTANIKDLRGGIPDVMKAFSGLAQSATAAGALDLKTKELIALGISIAARCDGCIAFHVKACVLAPHVNDWIVVDFNRAPPTRKDYDDATKIRARITDLVNAKAGRGVFRQIEVLHNHQAVDESSAALTEMCK